MNSNTVDESYHKPLIKHGVCSWTDPSLLTCGFYPKGCANNSERLRFFSTHMPCVEVDSSNYAIPPVDRVTKWVHVCILHQKNCLQ